MLFRSWRDASGTVILSEVHIDSGWHGEPISLIEQNTPARVAFLTRLGKGLIPDENTILQDGDLVHVIVAEKELSKVEATLGKSPENN